MPISDIIIIIIIAIIIVMIMVIINRKRGGVASWHFVQIAMQARQIGSMFEQLTNQLIDNHSTLSSLP